MTHAPPGFRLERSLLKVLAVDWPRSASTRVISDAGNRAQVQRRDLLWPYALLVAFAALLPETATNVCLHARSQPGAMRYAAYGSNLHPRRLAERISSAQLVTTGFLPDWSLHFHKLSNDGSGKCSIRLGEVGIYVAIFDISAADKLTLDGIEGLGAGYSETVLSVADIGDCVTYVAEPTHIDEALLPYDWYKELVLAGVCVHDFPADYRERIRSIPSRQDPDRDRRADRWKTVELVKSGG